MFVDQEIGPAVYDGATARGPQPDRVSADLEAGRAPAAAMVDGLLAFIAAVLLVVPGVLTDVVASPLLFPPSRRVGT